ncbi:MAG: hypothetical protein KDC84_13570 [Crocinitomicaceae bacterium]|nr:hypothetical protein [Crocinitomicaceae bacterium]
MNAFIRNDNEKELLLIFKEVLSSFDIDVEIESEALAEGGLKSIWKFIGKNGRQLTLIVTVCGWILTRIPVENKELTSLQIENLKLDNELKRAELRKLKSEAADKDSIADEVVEKVLNILDRDYKILWHKSNFYKRNSYYKKIDKISTTELNEKNEPINKERNVSRSDFSKFILRSNELPSLTDEEAIIELISPVLKKGNFPWKGFYKGEIISFHMRDEVFKNSILNREVEFTNGFGIKCVLQQTRKIDDTGLIKVTQNNVITVLETITSDAVEPTKQAEKYYRDKKLIQNQLTFGFHNKK